MRLLQSGPLNKVFLKTLISPIPPKYVSANIRRGIAYYPDLKIAYFKNSKSGSSTLLKTLWTATDHTRGTKTLRHNPRVAKRTPSQNIRKGTLRPVDADEIMKATHFTVVRHPLVRLVSAYRDKLKPDASNNVWAIVKKRYGLDPDNRPSFAEFVDLMSNDTPYWLDRHFRPQWINVAYGYIPYSHVGHLENLDTTARFLEAHGVPSIESFTPHATRATDYLKAFFDDPGVLKKAIALYEPDFETFHYAPSIENVLPLQPVSPPRVVTRPLRRVLSKPIENQAIQGSPG
jgi:hypothetical protein